MNDSSAPQGPARPRRTGMAVKELAETLLVGAVLTVLVAATMFMIVELLQRTS
jgi:hypothetical protein